ncbi:MAG: SPASM domain-containing protein [archaeon]
MKVREKIDDPGEIEKIKEASRSRRPCSALWKTPVIVWDGTLTICCFDGMMNLALGNVKDKSFKELWYGRDADVIRLHHIRGEFDLIRTRYGYQKCLFCRGYDIPTISDDEIIHYLKCIGKEEEIEPYLERIKADENR